MTSEVQRPATGGGGGTGGAGGGQDMFRPRPISQGGNNGYRFGQLSHNSFFTRHNPHPNRVRHLKGLLDVPICSVNDDGYFSSPRYSLQFPPNHFNNSKMNKWKGRIPVNTVNVNNPLHSINTVTGLQYFMGLNSYPWRERAIPKVGLVPVTETWRDELKRFAEQLTDVPLTKDPAKEALPKDEDRPRTTQYSTNTGRLIPPPSRALSRGNSRRAQRGGNMPFYFNNLEHISPSPDVENVVLTMLCQILQTEDINAVQAWLCSAGDREKTMVMEMMQAAMAGREEYWKQHPAMMMEPSGLENNPTSSSGKRTKLPPIEGAPRPPTGEINRLVLDEGGPAAPALEPSRPPLRTVVDDKDFAVEAPTNSVFRPPSPPKKAASQQPQRPPSVPCAPAAPVATAPAPAGQEEPTTSAPPRPISSPDARVKTSASKAKAVPKIPAPESLAMWNQMESVNTF